MVVCCRGACGWMVGLGLGLAGMVFTTGGLRAQAPPTAAATASSPAEAVLAFRDAANFQNNGAYELAIEEWQAFLKRYGKDPLAPKARHYLGVCQVQVKDFAAAEQTLAGLLKEQPQFELREETLLQLATAQYAQGMAGQADAYRRAAATFGELAKAFPQSKYADDALFYQAEALYAQGEKAQAARLYQQHRQKFAQSKRGADVLYALGVAQEELGDAAAAGQTYAAFLKTFPQHPLATEVKLRQAETLLSQGNLEQAARLFGEVAGVQGFAAADQALARQAYCLARLERFAEAGATYARLATGFPQSTLAAEATLSAGRCYFRADDAEAARRWLERAMKLPGEPAAEAAHWLCRLLLKKGQPAEAAQIAAKAQAAASTSPFAAQLALDEADALFELPGQQPRALERYVRFAREFPQHELAGQALYHAAYTALSLKRFDEALQHAQAVEGREAKHPLAAEAGYVASEALVQLGRYDEAVMKLRNLLNQFPDHAERNQWRLRLGLVAHLQKDHTRTLEILSPLVGELKDRSQRAEALFLIGACHLLRDAPELAVRALSEALEANPRWRQADQTRLLLARAEAKRGQRDKAISHLQRLVNEFPQSGVLDEALFRLGELYEAQGDRDKARRRFAEVTQRFPQSSFAPYAWYALASDHLRQQEYEQAAAAFTSLLSQFKGHPLAAESLLGRALCRRQMQDPRGALADLDALLASDIPPRRRSDARYERALALAALKDYAAAAQTLDSLLTADPDYPAADKVLYELGWARKALGESAPAAQTFERLARHFPDSPLAAEAWFHVGEEHYEQKRYEQAAEAYAAARARRPTAELTEKIAYKLGWAYYHLRDDAKALAAFRELLATASEGPLAPDARFMIGECLFRQEQFAQAWEAYQAALAQPPASPLMQALLELHAAQSASQLKQWSDSIRLLNGLIEQTPEASVLAQAYYERGWARQQLGQMEPALEDYEQAATRSRDEVGARARFMRGELLFAEKRHDQAIRDFMRVMYGFGGDQAPPAVRNWQAKSGFEAGRCAEVLVSKAPDAPTRQKYLADARKFYGFVLEKHAQHELAPQAKKRLDELSRAR